MAQEQSKLVTTNSENLPAKVKDDQHKQDSPQSQGKSSATEIPKKAQNNNFKPLQFKQIVSEDASGLSETDQEFHGFSYKTLASNKDAKGENENNGAQEDKKPNQEQQDAKLSIPQAEDVEIDHLQNQPPAPIISEEFLKTLHDSAYAQGYQDGKEMAEQEAKRTQGDYAKKITDDLMTQDRDDLLAKVTQVIHKGLEMIEQAERDRDIHLLMLILEILRKVLPGVLQKYGTVEIEYFFNEILASTHVREALQINLPKMADYDLVGKVRYILRGNFASDADMEQHIYIHEDETLGFSDCKISWKNGGAIRDYDAIWADVEQILSRHMWLGLPTEELEENEELASPKNSELAPATIPDQDHGKGNQFETEEGEKSEEILLGENALNNLLANLPMDAELGLEAEGNNLQKVKPR